MVRASRLLHFIPALSDANEANCPLRGHVNLARESLQSAFGQGRSASQEPAPLLLPPLLLCRLQVTPPTQRQPPQVGAHQWGKKSSWLTKHKIAVDSVCTHGWGG